MEEGGHRPGYAAEREGDGRVAEDGGEVGFVLQEGEDSSLLEFGLVLLAGSACRFLHEDGDEDGDDDAGDGGDDEGVAPTEAFSYYAADEVAEGCSYEEGDVEDGEDSGALVFGVEVREDCGSEDAEAGFTDAEGGVADQQRVIGVDAGGEEVDAGPEEGCDD